MSVSDLTSKPPPEPAAAQGATVVVPARQSALAQFCHRYALLFAWAATIALFSLLEPDSFLQIQNFTSIFNSQAVLVVLTCSLVLTLTSS
jgi:ribose transport system permease protein